MILSQLSETELLLGVRNLSITIDTPNGSLEAVRDVSFDIHHGETLACVGESGSGKTLTALALLGLLPRQARQVCGRIRFMGRYVSQNDRHSFAGLRGKHLSMIFQEPTAALNPVLPVGRQVSDVIETHLEVSPNAAELRVLELFASVGLRDPHEIYGAYPHQLSGGMAQRVMIAMALSCSPTLIVADEITTALDVTTQWQILKLIRGLQRQHRFALLLISHDIHVVSAMAQTTLVMRRGRIVEKGKTKELLTRPGSAYTQRLVNSTFRLPTKENKDDEPCQVRRLS